MDITPFIFPIVLVVLGAVGSVVGIRLRRRGRNMQ